MKNWVFALFTFISLGGYSQVTVTNNQTVEWYIQNVLIGTGITISNVQFNAAAGNVVNEQVGQFIDPNSATGLPDGMILGSGDVTMAAQPNTGGGSTLGGATGAGVDTDLASLTLNQINDECVITFDFVPTGDSLVFSYVFASEEYEEYVCGSVNDAFGFFLTGTNPNGANYAATNLALVPDPLNPANYTTTGVSINTVNPGVPGGSGSATNCAALDPNWASYNVFYAGANTGTDFEYDGSTVVLECRAAVVCGETYTIKLAIGDGGDGAFDSGVFLEGGSFSSPQPLVEIRPLDENGDPIPNNNLPEGCINASILLIKPIGFTDSTYVIDLDISGTATNGVDYTQINPQYTIPAGQDTIELTLAATLDGITEGLETLIISTIFLTSCGDTLLVSDTLNITDIALNYGLTFNDTILECPTDSIEITVQPTGGIPNINYLWDDSNETTASVWVPATQFGTFYYPVLATDFCGITAYDSVMITVDVSIPPTINFVDDYIFTCVDQNGVNIAVDNVVGAFDPAAVTYAWNQSSPGTVNNVDVFPTTTLNWYFVTVFDGCNTVVDSVLVEVGKAEVDSVIIMPAQGCAGQGNSAGSVSVFPQLPNWSYVLVGNGTTLGPQPNNNFTSLGGNLAYNLLATDPLGCLLDTNIFVPQDNATLTATFEQDSLFRVSCFGGSDGSAQITNVTGGINPTNGGPYDVVWTHNNGSTVPGASNIATGDGDAVTNLFAGSWQVLVVEQTSGCAWSEAFTVLEPDSLGSSTLPNNPTCFGFPTGSIVVNGLGGTLPYDIEIEDDQGNMVNIAGSNVANLLVAGVYTYELSDASGCSSTGSVTLIEPGQISVTFEQDDILCFGRNTGSVNITNVFNYGGIYDSIQFFWTPSPNGGDGVGKTFENGMAPGQYIVNILDQNGCNNDTLITIQDAIPIEITADFDPADCRTTSKQVGNAVLIGSAVGGAGNFTYIWESIETGESTNTTTWGGRNAGSYRLSVLDQNGCLESKIVEVDSVIPIAAFSVESPGFEGPAEYEGTEDLKVTFINESEFFANPNNPFGDTTFLWNLNASSEDGSWYLVFNYEDKIDTTYSGENVFEVCLIAQNYNDCKDTACVEIIVRKEPELIVPNVFTPGAEPNNTFFFPSAGINEFEATVFNRYGVKVYEYTDITDKWDGTHFTNGKPCSDGTYFFIYKAKSTNGTRFEGEGSVVLIRAE